MRKIEIKKENGKVIIYVGVVDQSCNYKTLVLSEAEAGVLSAILPEKI